MPGAGKTTLARELEATGYQRINRDEVGGSLASLLPHLEKALSDGQRRVVLDNTYPSRASRNQVIETAWRLGAQVRCVWLQTTIGDAQINAIQRMIEIHGSLPTPEEIRERGKQDTRYLLPDAQFRYERTLEPPSTDEGFEEVDSRAPGRLDRGGNRALILDLDEAPSPDLIRQYQDEGWLVFVHGWRPQVARGEMTKDAVEQEFQRLRQALGEMDWAYCPHDAGPPVCWCRKPIPGQAIEFAMRRDVALHRSIVVGSSAAARTMAERLGTSFAMSLESRV
jgi:hypothetical protein